MDCLKEVMLEITRNNFEGRNKTLRGPYIVQTWCTPWFNAWFKLNHCADLVYGMVQCISVARILDGGGQNRKSRAMTSSEIFEKRDFYGTKNERSNAGGLI